MENVNLQVQESMMTLFAIVKGEFKLCVTRTFQYICVNTNRHLKFIQKIPHHKTWDVAQTHPCVAISYIMATIRPRSKVSVCSHSSSTNLAFSSLWAN
jgi:hypothetical protein